MTIAIFQPSKSFYLLLWCQPICMLSLGMYLVGYIGDLIGSYTILSSLLLVFRYINYCHATRERKSVSNNLLLCLSGICTIAITNHMVTYFPNENDVWNYVFLLLIYLLEFINWINILISQPWCHARIHIDEIQYEVIDQV